jgi:hypothetical protein
VSENHLLHEILREEMFQSRLLELQTEILEEIRNALRKKEAASATLTFKNSTGGTSMSALINVGGTATATFLEWSGPNGTGSQVPPVGAVTYASDNPAVATVNPNTGIATGVSAGTANISGADAGNSLTASDVLTVQAAPPPPAVSATLTLVANSSARPQASRR